MAKHFYSWGRNEYGQAANGKLSVISTPSSVSNDWDKISLNTFHGLGLKNGKLYGWGGNYYGELGSYESFAPFPPTSGFTPVRLGSFSDCTDIAAGGAHSLIIRNGKLYSSGSNAFGALGNGNTETTEENAKYFNFAQVGTDNDWAKVFASSSSSYAIKTNGDLYVWGYNDDFELGIEKEYPDQIWSPQFAITLTPTKINNQSWQTLSTTVYGVLAISNGRLFVWGKNENFKLGLGESSSQTDIKEEPFQIGSGTNWVKVVDGYNAAFAIKTNGTLWVSGNNGDYYTGLGSSSGYTKSFTQVGSSENWENVAASSTNAGAVGIKNGNLFAWGINEYNGSGSTGYTETPTLINDEHNWFNVYSGAATFAGLAETGQVAKNTLYSWSENDYGELGNGTSESSQRTPLKIDGEIFDTLGTSSFASCSAIKNGRIYIWGSIPSTQNILPNYDEPTEYEPADDFDDWEIVGIGSGLIGNSIMALRDGKIYSGGDNSWGYLGFAQNSGYSIGGSGLIYHNFQQVGSSSDWKKIFPSSVSPIVSFALKEDGTLWSCGSNLYKQLGHNNTNGTIEGGTSARFGFSQVSGSGWKQVAIGNDHVLAVKENGTLWAWGTNGSGQLGDETTTTRTTPIQIGTETNWKYCHAGLSTSFAIQENGTLWSCGDNANGTGHGNSGITDKFTQVGNLTGWQKISGGTSGYAALKNYQLYVWGVNDYNGTGGTIGSFEFSPVLIEGDKYFSDVSNFYTGGMALRINGIPPVIDKVETTSPGTKPSPNDEISAGFEGSFDPNDAVSYEWEKKPPGGDWETIDGANDPIYKPKPDDVDYEIRPIIIIENEFGSDTKTGPSTGLVRSAYSTENWRFLFHGINGTTLGEFTDLHNFKLNVGLNKNSDISFDTTLKSNLGQLLADSLNDENPIVIVTAWRYDPYNEVYRVQFSGPIFSVEEKGTDDNPTLGVTAVGGYYRLTKRIANNDADQGRRQSGISPTNDTLELLVTDNTGNRIMVYNAKSGSYLRKWGSSGSGNGQFNNPYGIAVGPQNYVYVADTDNNRIQKFALDGTYISKWNTVQNSTSYLSFPIDVAVDQSSGDVWVADRGNKQVVKYDSDGVFLFRVQATVNCPMDNLRGISVDFEGNAYISDATDLTTNPENQGVYKITPTGQIIVETSGVIASAQRKFALDPGGQAYWVNINGQLRKGPGKPKLTSRASSIKPTSTLGQSVVLGPDRSIYFLESNNTDTSRVKRLNPATNESKVIGSYGTNNGETRNAKGIALCRSGSRDAVEIIDEIITESNDRDGHSWIEPASSQGEGTKLFIQPGSLGGFRTVASLIEEFNQNYEWEIIPKFEESGGNLLLGEWHANAVLGSNKATDGSVIFEYGFGRHNVDSYTIKKSIEGLANKINYPVSDKIPYNVTSISKDSISQIGLFEDIVTGGIVDTNLRKKLTDLHLFYRTLPRLLVEIIPTRSDQSGPDNTRVPIPLLEYKPGDIIGLEIKEEDVERIPAAEARIYDMSIELDAEGRETCSLNLYLNEG